jgi:oligopeptidase B
MTPHPPRASQRNHVRSAHGSTLDDPWFWLRDREDEDVLSYLAEENEYTQALVSAWGDLPNRLFEEIRSRIQETDMSVPVKKGPWWYQARTEEGAQYPIHVRRADADGEPQGPEVVLLDENSLAGDSPYLAVGDLAVSPDHALMAYSVDLDGDEYYELRVRDLATGEEREDVVPDVSYGVVWANDNATFYYLLTDDTHRPHRVMRHTLGADPSEDELVFEELDPQFWVGLGSTRSEQFVVIATESSTTSEMHLLDADEPRATPRVVMPRSHGHEYRIEHHGDRLLIMTNDNAPDFRLVETPLSSPSRDNWSELVPAQDGVRLNDVDAFDGFLVITSRHNNVPRLSVHDLSTGEQHDIEFSDEIFEAAGGANAEFEATTYRFGYTSMTAPSAVFEYDLVARTRRLLKRQAVLGNFDETNYRTARDWATSPDGTQVPVSIVWHKDTALDGSAPGLLYGYGSYEIIMPASFSSARLSLLDRGFVFAIAHVRGGGELGRAWYDGARYAKKANTFVDFIAVAEHLATRQWIDADKLVCRGGSAGGLLVGAVLNMRPDLFAAAVAEVPFVDNVNTMLDASLPLTVNEYDEWGNPEDPAIFDAMRAYSPYENVRAEPYPALYVTAGLNDPRVQYWEPAKWVAKLRTMSTSDTPIMLKTEMGAGHGGPSGRYDAWRDEAETLAFVLNAVGIDT